MHGIKKHTHLVPSSDVGRYLSPEQLAENNKPLILGDVGPHFYAAASLYPTTPEEGSSTNILVWPKEMDPENPIGLEDVSHDDMWSLSEYALGILDVYPDSAVTYGISEDPRGITGQTRKALGTSIQAFHLHNYIDVRKDLQPPQSKGIYRSIREPFPQFIASAFKQFLDQNGVTLEGFRTVESREKNSVLDPYVNVGGIVYSSTDTQPGPLRTAHFADAMSLIHTTYYGFHDEVMRIFFSNYDAVRESKWSLPYDPREQADIVRAIENSQFITDGNLANFLIKASGRVVKSDSDALSSDLKIFRSPTYSVGAVKNADGVLCLAVNPHFYAQRAGGLQTLGIEVAERIRHEDKDPYEVIRQRTDRAKNADLHIRESLKSATLEAVSSEESNYVPLEGHPIQILNNISAQFDEETEQLISEEMEKIIAAKKGSLPEGTAFYNGPAFFPHVIRKDETGQFLIEGSNYSSEGYFRHVALRDSEAIHRGLTERGITARAGLAVSILVEVQFDNGDRKIVLTKSAPTEYAPQGAAQMPGGSYQQKSDRIHLPDPVLLAQQELVEEMGLYTDVTSIQPLAYLTGAGKTNPTLIYKTVLDETQYNQMANNIEADMEHAHIDNDKAHEFVLIDIEDITAEVMTNGARRVIEVVEDIRKTESARERT